MVVIFEVILSALAVLLLLLLLWRVRFSRQVARLEAALATASMPDDRRATLPPLVRAFAEQAVTAQNVLAHRVLLHQSALLRLSRGGAWQAYTARQLIAFGEPGFIWDATRRFGPIPLIRVIDSYLCGAGRLQARLVGAIRLADMGGADMDRGEAMRYLAELPWAPDAILGNPDIFWQTLAPDRVSASLVLREGVASVTFRFDESGDIVEMLADDRPATDASGAIVLRRWRGLYADYGLIGGRRIPLRGEVGYVYDDGFEAYWRGQITGYELHAS